jgi:hypothetical protein
MLRARLDVGRFAAARAHARLVEANPEALALGHARRGAPFPRRAEPALVEVLQRSGPVTVGSLTLTTDIRGL